MTAGTLTLADGTVINQSTGRPVRNTGVPTGYVRVPSAGEAINETNRVRKRLADLPDVPERMNVVALVASYYMFGLEDHEIAYALKCTEGQVANIKLTDAFGKLIEVLTQNIVESGQNDVRTMLAQGALDAANAMLRAVHSENEQTAVVAAKDVLDRSGHRPVDVVEHRHRVEGGLTIEYVKKGGKDDTLPVIDINAEDVTDANG